MSAAHRIRAQAAAAVPAASKPDPLLRPNHGRRLHAEAEAGRATAYVGGGATVDVGAMEHRHGTSKAQGKCMPAAKARSLPHGKCLAWAGNECDCEENYGKNGCPDPSKVRLNFVCG